MNLKKIKDSSVELYRKASKKAEERGQTLRSKSFGEFADKLEQQQKEELWEKAQANIESAFSAAMVPLDDVIESAMRKSGLVTEYFNVRDSYPCGVELEGSEVIVHCYPIPSFQNVFESYSELEEAIEYNYIDKDGEVLYPFWVYADVIDETKGDDALMGIEFQFDANPSKPQISDVSIWEHTDNRVLANKIANFYNALTEEVSVINGVQPKISRGDLLL